MAVFIWQDDAFEKMVEVEGEDWSRHVKGFGSCGFEAFYNEWMKSGLTKEDAEVMKKEEPERYLVYESVCISVEGNAAIYGYGGWNRYIVNMVGEIFFHEDFCDDQATQNKAVEVGFRLFSEKLRM